MVVFRAVHLFRHLWDRLGNDPHLIHIHLPWRHQEYVYYCKGVIVGQWTHDAFLVYMARTPKCSRKEILVQHSNATEYVGKTRGAAYSRREGIDELPLEGI